MEPNIRLIPFASPNDNGWSKAWEIYENSFPYKECRSQADHLRALADSRFTAMGVWLDDHLVGILNYWTLRPRNYYVEHLAIDSSMRGLDLGSHTLRSLYAEADSVVLEIDPPIDDVSIRRRHFYQRLGFVENPQEYLHPSFRRPFTTHKLVLMSYPDLLPDTYVRGFADFVRETVLCCSEHEHPELPR